MADNFLERRYEQLQARKSAVRPTAPKAPGERRIGIITGGANGIGRCLVDAFVDKGYKIYFIDKDSEQIAAVERSMQGRRGTAIGFAGDIAEQSVLEAFAAFVLEREKHIHCLINNACLMRGGILSDCSYEDFLYVQRVGVAAPFYLARLFKNHFDGLGSIVNLSSTRAFQSQPDTESYTAAKGGITALTHALAVSLAGIARVNAIAPGWIETGAYQKNRQITPCEQANMLQHPSQRIGNPADIARMVLFLCDPQNTFINGECIRIDGGMSHLMVYHNDHGWSYREEKE